MMGSFDVHGDLGRAEQITPAEKVPLLAIRAAHYLKAVARISIEQNFETEKGLRYAIEFGSGVTENTLREVENHFPRGVEFYQLEGRRAFDMRGGGGGIAVNRIAYVVCYPRNI